MDKQFLSIIAGLLLLASCAQVGTISGGQKDSKAPGIVENGLQPPNGNVQFQSRQISLTFDEYIRLNNPAETISIAPADVKVKAELKKRTVLLTLEGDLKPETTYAIYLNGTVQDITESNDSLIQYVFSTGDYIDTISYTGKVTDAFTYAPLKNVLVGLYSLADTTTGFNRRPAYFAQTDAQGNFTCSYIKPGSFRVLAFEDQNRDLIWQQTERLGFKSDLIQLDSTLQDSIPIRVYAPERKPKARSISFEGPGLLTIGSNSDLRDAEIFVDGIRVEGPKYQYTNDSIAVLVQPEDVTELSVVVRTADFSDTLGLRLSPYDKTRNAAYHTNLKNGTLLPAEHLLIRFSDRITDIDTTKMQLLKADTLSLPFTARIAGENVLEVIFDSTDNSDLKFRLLQQAVSFAKSKSLADIEIAVKHQLVKNFGTIVLSAKDLPDYAIIQVMDENTVVRRIPYKSISEKLLIETLEPKTYTFRVLLDENGNGKWDGGNFARGKQPEKILFFNEGVKVRANWEMEALLTPEK
jgi:uncharacterized protein (DUF2141 family)